MQNIGYMLADNSRLLRRAFDERVRKMGVTSPQARLLLILARDGGRNQGSYAERLEVEPITLCRMVDRLQEAELVERRPDPADRRAWQLFLTRKAERRVAELRGCVDDMLDETLAGFSAADRAALVDLLERMGQNLGARRTIEEVAHG